ncbi:peroxiredoxin [Halomarina litorea]|uniref:peroxiredoxin n=1 Tax=Halomarina litorea TaxID=2961595 RepID=UPI0020C50F48|nr:redoxin domain-containing protein [Halomarina sp. BCD28]
MTDADGLAVGERAPDVSGSLVRPDGPVEETALTALLADGPVLLAFYTNDFSPDCTREWCAFRDYEWFAVDGAVQVVGVSRSRVGTHRKFIDHLGLSFPLFADTDLAMARAFDVDYRTFGVFARSRRSTFLVGTDRTVRHVWLGDHALDPTLDRPDMAELRAAIEREFGDSPTDDDHAAFRAAWETD